jgi:hypothetical protein
MRLIPINALEPLGSSIIWQLHLQGILRNSSDLRLLAMVLHCHAIIQLGGAHGIS